MLLLPVVETSLSNYTQGPVQGPVQGGPGTLGILFDLVRFVHGWLQYQLGKVHSQSTVVGYIDLLKGPLIGFDWFLIGVD